MHERDSQTVDQLDEGVGARHFVPENHPDRVARAVTSLLGRLSH